MYDYLIDHAQKNVWCAPEQDMQYILKPVRITAGYGASGSVRVLDQYVTLPKPQTQFHVFQVGQLHPLILGLFPAWRYWKNLAENCNEQVMVVDLYSDNGVQLTRAKCWYMVTSNKNLLLAVEVPSKGQFDPGTENLYFRVYTSAYFQSLRAKQVPQAVQVKGGNTYVTADILVLQDEVSALRNAGKTVACFVNGRLVDAIDLINAVPGDEAEYVYDSAIKRTVDFTVADLTDFNSTLDTKRKYLLHYPVPEGQEPVIEYHDDIDVYVYYPGTNGRYKGVYLHRNTRDAVRMLTHRDYSIPLMLLDAIRANNPTWTDPMQLRIRLNIRHSGFERPLVYEHNRIHELYQLPTSDLRRALLGIDSTVPNWRAAHLEAAAYPALMREPNFRFTRELVEEAYGYNALSTALANTPQKVELLSGVRGVKLPYGLMKESTGFEYDAQGKLLAWHSHVDSYVYPTRDILTETVELVPGYCDLRLDETYGITPVALNPRHSYRFYTSPTMNGEPTNVWTDVTGTSRYLIQNGQCVWNLPPNTLGLVRSDAVGLAYSIEVTPFSGVTQFALRHQAYRKDVLITQNMQIPMGELDVFLNGHSLIEGIDYLVDFPRVIIISKRYLVAPENGTQHVTVRFTGFCTPDMRWNMLEDKGFVNHGTLSNNQRYNVRDDKVMRVVLKGSIQHRANLKFAEHDQLIVVPDALNGEPYLIRDMVPALREHATVDTYVAKAASVAIDTLVSDYLTLKYPVPPAGSPNVIASLYPLYSPFINAIIHDFRSGFLTDERLYQRYNEALVEELAAPYLYYLASDPTQVPNETDYNYTEVHPHIYANVVALPIHQYQFVARLINRYMPGKVKYSHFVSIQPV